MNYDRPDLLHRLASEYVLGTLRGRARRRFEQIQRRLPAARDAVAQWQRHLGQLAGSVPPAPAPSRVWQAIEARIDAPAAAASRPKRSWLGGWLRPALGFALGAALTVGLVTLHPTSFTSLDDLAQREQALPQSYVGLLTDAQNRPTLLVSSTRYDTVVTVKFLRPVEVPPGKVLQLWALPAQGDPFPLGVATPAAPPKSTTFQISAASEQLLSKVTRLAATFADQPATARSTPGEFVYSGFCVKLW